MLIQPFTKHSSQSVEVCLKKCRFLRQKLRQLAKFPTFTRWGWGLYLKAFCAGIPEIMFLRGVLFGVFVLVALFAYPQVLLMGTIAVVSAYGFAALANLGRDYLAYGFYTFNPLLSGLGIGYLFKFSPISLLLAVGAGILTFLFTWVLSHCLRIYFRLPVLSLPFVIVSWLVHLAAFTYAGLEPSGIIFSQFTGMMPLWLEGFFRTLGFIFFLPNTWIGIAIAVTVLVRSRILFFLAAMGYGIGTGTHGLLVGSFDYIYYDIGAINYVLIAIAIGGFYLIPSPKSYLLAALAVVCSSVMNDAITIFWSAVSIPAHAIAYNVITLLLLYSLGIVASPILALRPQPIPERDLDQGLNAPRRYCQMGWTIALPFSGKWSVWQGFDGRWTHQGLWRHAYDFVIRDERGQTYSGDGLNLSDYYAYHKPVLSPISGQVVQVVSDLPDCEIAAPERAKNWGNHVILWDDRGFYVEISHFTPQSILVKPGDRVEIGSFLGRCGNSGYSPQPHIHIQVQRTPQLGSATIPFCFGNVMDDDCFFTDALPPEGAMVANAAMDRNLAKALTFSIDQQLDFVVCQRGEFLQNLSLQVRMAADGCLYFDSGKGKLYFSAEHQVFMCHRLEGQDVGLAALFLALPKVPLTRCEGQSWSDSLPASLAVQGWLHPLLQLGCSFVPALASMPFQGRWRGSCLEGCVQPLFSGNPLRTGVEFDEMGGLKRITVCSLMLSRMPNVS